jgi:putative DNA methylase
MPVPFDHVRSEGKAGRMGTQLMAIVAEGDRGRIYQSPNSEHTDMTSNIKPEWVPDADLPNNPRDFKTPNYGMKTFGDLFTPRQLVALTTFSDLVTEAREKIKADAVAAGMVDDGASLNDEGMGAVAYANAIATYLAFAVDRCTDYWSAICSWNSVGEKMRNTFGRKAIPMVWDYAECYPFSKSSGNFSGAIDWIAKAVEYTPCNFAGFVEQRDATKSDLYKKSIVVSTDPPYYANIDYADLSDFFYVWLRRTIGSIYPDIFSTLLVPKAQELVATPYRFGGNKQKAKEFFEEGLSKTFKRMREMAHDEYPFTVYYAFK